MNNPPPISLLSSGTRWAARELLFLSTNFVLVEAAWWSLAWVRGIRSGESLEGIGIVAIVYLPFAFLVTYVVLRISLSWAVWANHLRSLTFGCWIFGIVLGPLLALAGTYTKFFWLFTPALKCLGIA